MAGHGHEGWWAWLVRVIDEKTRELQWLFASRQSDSAGPWQERLLIFILLCAMVAWLSKIGFSVRERWGSLSSYWQRGVDTDDDSDASDVEGAEGVVGVEMMPRRGRAGRRTE